MPAWLDIMPAIPLARGVPVRNFDGTDGLVLCVPPATTGIELRYVVNVGRYESQKMWKVNDCTADLDDPQGFAFAWRALVRINPSVTHKRGSCDSWYWLCGRYEQDKTTDADRLALARALAAVTP